MTNTISRSLFEDAIQDLGYEGIRDEYSGRGMYGATCFGIVTGNDMHDVRRELEFHIERLWESISELEPEDDAVAEEGFIEDLTAMLRSISQDNMGRDMIVYFPGWQLAD